MCATIRTLSDISTVTGEEVVIFSLAGAPRFGRVASKTCPVTTRVYALGKDRRSLKSASIETTPGRCPAVTGVNGAFDATEVGPSDFVEGVPVTE